MSRFIASAVCALALAACASKPTTIYEAQIKEVKAVDGVEVQVTAVKPPVFRVSAINNTAQLVKAVWDESAYVTTGGKASRLVRGETRTIDSAQAQPPSPIPPGATLSESVVPEMHVDAVRRAFYPAPTDPNARARLVVTFDLGGAKVSWEAEILYVPMK